LPAKAGNPVFTNAGVGRWQCRIDVLRSTGSSAFADDDGGGWALTQKDYAALLCAAANASSMPGTSRAATGRDSR
jgi:hypothetical protein